MSGPDSLDEKPSWNGEERRQTSPEWELINVLVTQIADDNKESREVNKEGFDKQSEALGAVKKEIRTSMRYLGLTIIVVVAMALGASKIEINGSGVSIEKDTPASTEPEEKDGAEQPKGKGDGAHPAESPQGEDGAEDVEVDDDAEKLDTQPIEEG